MRIKIEQFLRSFAIRTSGELLRPRLFNITKLKLPHNVIYHFVDSNTAVAGPNQTDPLFNRYRGKVFIDHVTQLQVIEGNPIRTSVIAATIQNEFRRNNRFFKPLRKIESVKLNTQNIAIYNYNLLNQLYRYHANIKAGYNRWSNISNTFWHNVVTTHASYGKWNQFVEIELPRTMPKYADFRRMERETSKSILEIFNNDALLTLSDFIKFFGENQETSNMYQVLKPTVVKGGPVQLSREILDQINIIVRVKNNFFVINLGKLYDFRDSPETIVEQSTVSTEMYVDSLGLEAAFKPNVLQLKLVSLFTTLVEYNNGIDDNIETEEVETADADVSETEVPSDELDEDLDDDVDTKDVTTTTKATTIEEDETLDREEELALIALKAKDSPVSKTLDLGTLEITYTPPPDTELELTTLVIEKDELSELDKPSNILTVPKAQISGTIAALDESDPNTAQVVKLAYELANAGAISPRSYEQAVAAANGYKTIPSPFNPDVSIAEDMEILPEDLKLPEKEHALQIVNSEKSMGKSIHKQMNQKYINTLQHKDVLKSIIGVQTLGVTVADVQMEEFEDSLNHFRTFKVTLKPVRGKQSTVRFNIPVIDSDGRFRANGVTFKQRSQIGDIPIRKVSPTKVALTSYYSKLFVRRSARVTNDYDKWLIRNINLMSRNDGISEPTVVKLRVAEKDLSEYKLPRIYSGLGSVYNGFTTDGLTLHFDYTERVKYFDKLGIDVTAHETDGFVVAGHRGKVPVVVDTTNQFYLVTPKDLEPLGLITDILNLSLAKAPLEIATLTVLNKEVPLGLIMAYHKGLTNLLNDRQVDYQSHPRGTRLKLSDDEFTLVFTDEVLVFNRGDYANTLLIAGLKRYQKTLQQFSRWDFDRQDVYFRVLDAAGLTANYVREIDTLFTSWIDPITRDILADAGEPTEFEPLLYRAIELLLTDWSPSEVDGAYMRYKGYERTAGTVYNTLIRSVKIFNARQGRGEQSISLDPYEIWKKVTSDPTVSVVEDSNPLQNLKEEEVVTFSGDGGRPTKTMVARTRGFHKNDIGVVSEATVDSGNVGAIFYLTPDANFANMRGITKPYNPETDGVAKVFSTTALVSVNADRDDQHGPT